MTVQRVSFLQNLGTVYPAEEMRRFLRFLGDGRAGVNKAGDLQVTQNGSPNMSVNIAAGEGGVIGGETANQGLYWAYNDATLNRTISTADATNPRNDLVALRVRDQFYSGTFNDGDVVVVTGTPAPSPVDPTPSFSNYILLARVRVNAGASSITNANITDLRTWFWQTISPGGGGLQVKDSTGAFNNLSLADSGLLTLRNALVIPSSAGGTVAPTAYGSVGVKLDEKTGTGASGTITFSGIPTIYRKLVVDIFAQADNAITEDVLRMTLHNDSSGVYDSQLRWGSGTGGAWSSSESNGAGFMIIGFVPGTSSPAGHVSHNRIEIGHASSTSVDKPVTAHGGWSSGGYGAGKGNVSMAEGWWHPASPAAVDRIDLILPVGNFKTPSTAILVGQP